MNFFDYAGLIGDFATAGFIGFFLSALSVFFVVIGFIFEGAKLTRISHKLNVYEHEAFAYIPILRDCYRMRMAGFKPILGVFLNGSGLFIIILLVSLLTGLFKSVVASGIALVAGIIACLYFSYRYYNRILQLFGFEGTMALLYFIPGMGIILWVIGCIVAFSNKFDENNADFTKRLNVVEQKLDFMDNGKNAQNNVNKAMIIHGMSGKYQGCHFEIKDNESITIGRDLQKCNIVFEESFHEISRVHCTVKYSAMEKAFYVTDYSSNGTFVDGQLKIGKQLTKKLPVGTVICLGNEKNSFRLG